MRTFCAIYYSFSWKYFQTNFHAYFWILSQMSAASSTMSEAEERKMRMKKYSTLLSRPGLRKQFERFAKARLI